MISKIEFRQLLSFFRFLKPLKFAIFFVFLCIFISAACNGIFIYMVKNIVNYAFETKNMKGLKVVCTGMFILFSVRFASSYLFGLLSFYVREKTALSVRKELFKKMVNLNVKELYKFKNGYFQDVFLSNVNVASDNIILTFFNFFKDVISVISLVVILFIQNFKLSCFAFFFFPIPVYFIAKINKKIKFMLKDSFTHSSNISSMVMNCFDGIKTIKCNSAEISETIKFSKTLADLFRLSFRMVKKSTFPSPFMEFCSGLGMLLVFLYGGYSVIKGESTSGAFFSFIFGFLSVYRPSKSLSSFNLKFQTFVMSVVRIEEFLSLKTALINGSIKKNIQNCDIEFRNVSFKYIDTEEKNTIEDMSFIIKTGQKIGIVGKSGGGKSTILDFFPRFVDPDSGEVLIGGENLKNLDYSCLRKQMSYCGSDSLILEDTILNNITYGRGHNVVQDEIDNAIKLADAEFIYSLPSGINTQIGKDFSLSFGQRQRIIICRSFLKKAQLYLFDEITSALDMHTEAKIKESIYSFCKDATVIFVSHRLSMVSDCDLIIVVDGGSIVETGSHNELIERDGYYKRLLVDNN